MRLNTTRKEGGGRRGLSIHSCPGTVRFLSESTDMQENTWAGLRVTRARFTQPSPRVFLHFGRGPSWSSGGNFHEGRNRIITKSFCLQRTTYYCFLVLRFTRALYFCSILCAKSSRSPLTSVSLQYIFRESLFSQINVRKSGFSKPY